MSFLEPIWQDLKARKLLPVAAALLVAIVAVPIVLSSSSSTPTTSAQTGALPTTPADGLPAVSETTAPPSARINGPARDPFTPTGGGSTAGPAAVAARPVSTGTSTATPAAGSTPSPSGSSTGGTPVSSGGPSGAGGSPAGGSGASSGGQNPPLPSKIPTGPPKHVIPSLKPDQSYKVTLAITNSAGGINTIDPLERLSPLPSQSDPMLVELGVLQGGSRVLFAVEPGAVLAGPGTCVPGPIDCEILSLAQGQTEKVSVRFKDSVTPVAMFAVTGIAVASHPSAAATQRARRAQSAAGRRVLSHSQLGAVSLFRYEPSVGAVVDLRNLTLRDS